MLVTGLLTSFHCVMMCGNMVLSYAVKGNEEGPVLRRMVPHFAYHSAKIVSYTLVGLLLGSVGALISQGARNWVSVIAGGYMILLGLNMTGRFPVLNHLTPRPPRFLMTALMKLRRRSSADAAAGESSVATPVTFGLMTGLMPCGPLQAAQIAAAGAGAPLSGALAMLGFGLGTVPLMLGYGAVASYLSGRFKKYMAVTAAVVIIVLGVVMINRGATALGSPVTFNTIKQSALGSGSVALDESNYQTGADGVVEVPLGLEGYTFTPAILAIPADKPTRIIVDRKDANLCSDELWIPSLGIRAPLTPNGITKIDLPATKAGAYQITCQMGMLSATLQVGAGAARSGAGWLPWAALVLVAAWGLWRVQGQKQAAQRAAEEAARSRKGRKRTPVPAPSPALFGLSPTEVLLTGVATAFAAFVGLLFGGFFA